ncbi:MAG: HEAT repeat domain-containing protein [Planctomycetaceae bacterium]|nr:HEAT repeat domain-containing protein [Planctomycetaceae bacterium]
MNGRICRVALLFVLGFLITAPPVWSQESKESNDKTEKEEKAKEVDFLIKALSNPAARIRGNAFNALVKQDPKPYEALIAELAEGNQLEAASVALVIKELKKETKPLPRENLKAMYAILYNPATEPWRWNITATLISGATAKTGIAVDSLKDHIALWTWGVQHPAPIVQLPSLRALQKTGEDGKTAEHAVAGLLHRPQPPLTSIVLESAIREHWIIGLEHAFPDYTPLTILETLFAIKADAHLMVDPLAKLMHHPSEYVRLDAAAMLGKIESADFPVRQRAARVLAELATIPWSKVREEAVTELGNIGEPAATELKVLIDLLKDAKDEIRLQAAVSLGKLEAAAEPALPDLKEALALAKKLDTGEPVLRISEAIAAIEKAIKEDSKKETDTNSKEESKATKLPMLPPLP